MPRNTTGRGDPHAPVGEWGSRSRKAQARVRRQSNREAAIREGVADDRDAELHELESRSLGLLLFCDDGEDCPLCSMALCGDELPEGVTLEGAH